MGWEWFVSAVLAATGITVFGHFEEKTLLWRRLSKWAFYVDVTAALSRMPGRPWTFAWIFGLPGLRLIFHLWWCTKHGIDPLTAEPKETAPWVPAYTRNARLSAGSSGPNPPRALDAHRSVVFALAAMLAELGSGLLAGSLRSNLLPWRRGRPTGLDSTCSAAA